MQNLIPFAVIHIGVSVALAAMLILMHGRLHRADFLLCCFASDVPTPGRVETSNGVSAKPRRRCIPGYRGALN